MLFGQVPNMFCRRPRPVLDDVLQDRPTPLEQTIGPQTAEPEATEPEDIEPEVVESETTEPETVCYPFSFHTFPAAHLLSIGNRIANVGGHPHRRLTIRWVKSYFDGP